MTAKKLAGACALALIFSAISTGVQASIQLPDRHGGDHKFEYIPTPMYHRNIVRQVRHVKRSKPKLNKRKKYNDVNHIASSVPRPPRDVPDGCRSGVRALDCLVPELAKKAKEIVDACGSRVTSAVAPRGYRSNHPIRRAVDLADNPACIYSHLKDWKGGYSTDYHTAPGGRHVHISWNPGGQEWGKRFAHSHRGSGRHYAARRHRVRLAHAR